MGRQSGATLAARERCVVGSVNLQPGKPEASAERALGRTERVSTKDFRKIWF